MAKKRLHHHDAETEEAEKALSRFCRREEDEHARLERQRDADAVRLARRWQILKAVGIALVAAALIAVVGIVVRALL
jgi:hypothetical protein